MVKELRAIGFGRITNYVAVTCMVDLRLRLVMLATHLFTTRVLKGGHLNPKPSTLNPHKVRNLSFRA